MEELKKLNITILGKSYAISSNEDEGRLNRAAERVNLVMKSIAGKAVLNDNYKLAILAALYLANDLEKSEESLANLENKAKDLDAFLSDSI